MKRTLVVAAALAVTAVLVESAPGGARSGLKSDATTHVLTASLSPTSGSSNEASGTFTARLTVRGMSGTISWHLEFAHLQGQVTAAVHLGRPGKTGAVALPLCGPCHSRSHGSFSGPFGGQKKLIATLLQRGAYVDVETTGGKAGAIRGQVENWLDYTEASRNAELRLVGALGAENGGFNFDGYSSGALTIGVPRGWKVSVACSNVGTIPHSCAIVKNLKATAPIFTGATIEHPVQGLTEGLVERFHFTAAESGSYRIVCLVPGHEPAGMWDIFRVTRKGLPGVSLKAAQST